MTTISQFHPKHISIIPGSKKETVEHHEVSYYDLPLTDSSPPYEKKICEYLRLNNVKMSHPSVKTDTRFLKQRTLSLRSAIRRAPSLVQKRSQLKSSSSFVNLSINIGKQ